VAVHSHKRWPAKRHAAWLGQINRSRRFLAFFVHDRAAKASERTGKDTSWSGRVAAGLTMIPKMLCSSHLHDHSAGNAQWQKDEASAARDGR
jgi:hypothetical protein